MTEPADTYIIGGAGLPLATTPRPFDREYDPRGFQREALEWIYEDGSSPVAALAAPTGAGKTDVIAALGEAAEQLLCVYPTNALINAQQDALKELGLKVEIVTGDTLSGSGADRSQKLLNIAQRGQRGGQDVVITNPDVLQATIQNLYFSPGSRILNIYAQFDAAVYDEFHYYDPLAASGLLTQIKILSERGAILTPAGTEPPKFLLSSATPDTNFLEYVCNDLTLALRELRAELYPLDLAPDPDAPVPDTKLVYRDAPAPSEAAITAIERVRQADNPREIFEAGVEESVSDSEHVSRFRHPMFVRRHDRRLGESFDKVADHLAETIRDEYDGGPPIAAVIFNSAARSNAFQRYLAENRPELATDVTKDNGYDTNADRTIPKKTAALNTTSKGEVGLNFNIKRLVMANPFTATQFVQRIGRAGRRSPAIVDIYGLTDPIWPAIQSYPRFLRRVTDTLGDVEVRQQRLRYLTGMRAAYALHDRLTEDNIWHNESIFDDFIGFPMEAKWRAFFEDLDRAKDVLENDSWTGPTLDRTAGDTIRGALAVRDGLQSLRGRTIQHPVIYPHGGEQTRTEYSLVSALAHYSIDRVERNTTLHLTDDLSPGPLRGYYPGWPNGGDGIDLMQAWFNVERVLQDGYMNLVDSAEGLSDVSVDEEDLELFFRMMPVYAAMVPTRLRAGQFEIKCDTDYGEVENIVPRE